MYSYGFGRINNQFPDIAPDPESEKSVHGQGTCGLGMLRREPLGFELIDLVAQIREHGHDIVRGITW